jgi:hypothetical protein
MPECCADYAGCLSAELDEGGGSVEPAFKMPLESLGCKTAEIAGATGGPVLRGESCDGGLEDAAGEGERFRGKDAAGRHFVACADQAIGVRFEPCRFGAEGFAAEGAVSEPGHPAEEARDPEREVGDGHPDAVAAGVVEDGEHEAEGGFVGIVIGQGFFEDFGIEGESGGAGVVDRVGERGGDDFAGVEADEVLFRFFDVAGGDPGHGLEGSAEAATGFGGGFGYAANPAMGAGEQGDDLVGLMHGPFAENDGFCLIGAHGVQIQSSGLWGRERIG